MELKEGKYTLELFAEQNHLTRQSALNLLSKLRKQKYVYSSGGGHQKRIYTVRKLSRNKTNGFYDVVNKYSPEKLYPKFEHYIHGRYTVERAIVDGIKIGDIRTLDATMHLFRHVTNWKNLFDIAKKKGLEKNVIDLYRKARTEVKCKKMPERYL